MPAFTVYPQSSWRIGRLAFLLPLITATNLSSCKTVFLHSINIWPTSDPTANGISHILGSKKGGAPTGPLKIPSAKELPRKRNPSWPRERETVSTQDCQKKSGRGRIIQEKRRWTHRKVKSGECLGFAISEDWEGGPPRGPLFNRQVGAISE